MRPISTAVAVSVLAIFALAPRNPIWRMAYAKSDRTAIDSGASASRRPAAIATRPTDAGPFGAGPMLAQDDGAQAQGDSANSDGDANTSDSDDQNNANAAQNDDDTNNGADGNQNAQAGDNGDDSAQEPGYADDAQSDNSDAPDAQSDNGDDSTDRKADDSMSR